MQSNRGASLNPAGRDTLRARGLPDAVRKPCARNWLTWGPVTPSREYGAYANPGKGSGNGSWYESRDHGFRLASSNANYKPLRFASRLFQIPGCIVLQQSSLRHYFK